MEKIKSTQFITRRWSAPVSFPNFQQVPNTNKEVRKEKMRKVIAHLNRKPFRINWQWHLKGNNIWYLLISACIAYFITRALVSWLLQA